jgi:rod shape-determining protein MreD
VIDVLAFAVLVWSLRHGAGWGATFGFVIGLAADLDAAHWLGRHALILSVSGYVVGSLARTVVRESARTQFVLLALATLVHQTWVAPFELGGVGGFVSGWAYLLQRIAVSSLATAVAGTVVLVVARLVWGRPLFGHALGQPG